MLKHHKNQIKNQIRNKVMKIKLSIITLNPQGKDSGREKSQ